MVPLIIPGRVVCSSTGARITCSHVSALPRESFRFHCPSSHCGCPAVEWRPFGLDNACFPFSHGVGTQVGLTDPFFVAAAESEPFPEDEHPEFPYIAARQDELIRNGDAKATLRSEVSQRFVSEMLDPTKVWGDLPRLKKQ